MIIWELINPSDTYTLQGDDHEAACVANCCLGRGNTGLDAFVDGNKDESLGCPIFMFGGHDEWFKEKFGRSFEESLEAKASAAADILDTILAGSISERELFERSNFTWEEWQERNQSSITDYGRSAKALARSLRLMPTA